MSTETITACWADPLTRAERRALARLLARNCMRFWDAADPRLVNRHARNLNDTGKLGIALAQCSAEMSDLHLDVTERAEVAAS